MFYFQAAGMAVLTKALKITFLEKKHSGYLS